MMKLLEPMTVAWVAVAVMTEDLVVEAMVEAMVVEAMVVEAMVEAMAEAMAANSRLERLRDAGLMFSSSL